MITATVSKTDIEDIIEWADGTWCYRHELRGYLTQMSDDYTVLPYESAEWQRHVEWVYGD